ncbi:MAG: hypothetical protein LUE16_10920 [Lachnospiraceae bacterium]|nr:hypothetical protein [Lachnospiraceae bacterium]
MKDDLLLFGKPIQKQITFDLSDRRLREYYPRQKMRFNPQYYKKAWRDIGSFMYENGFVHRQYSVYISILELTSIEINTLIKSMVEDMPWLHKCLIVIGVTDIGEQFELMPTVGKYAMEIETVNCAYNKNNS